MAKVILNSFSSIEKRLGVQENGPMQKYLATRVKERMNATYVPEDTQTLIDSSFITDDCSIVYPQKYASYQYYGQREDGTHKVKHYTKPGTGPYWEKRMLSAEGKDLEQDIQDYIGGKQ